MKHIILFFAVLALVSCASPQSLKTPQQSVQSSAAPSETRINEHKNRQIAVGINSNMPTINIRVSTNSGNRWTKTLGKSPISMMVQAPNETVVVEPIIDEFLYHAYPRRVQVARDRGSVSQFFQIERKTKKMRATFSALTPEGRTWVLKTVAAIEKAQDKPTARTISESKALIDLLLSENSTSAHTELFQNIQILAEFSASQEHRTRLGRENDKTRLQIVKEAVFPAHRAKKSHVASAKVTIAPKTTARALNARSQSHALTYRCSELTKSRAYALMRSGHTYLDRDSDGHPCEWGKVANSIRTPTYKSRSNCHYVRGYRRKNGSYVRGHMRCR